MRCHSAGMIDKSGEFKIPANYVNISPKSEGLVVATKTVGNGFVKCVTIDSDGVESDLF